MLTAYIAAALRKAHYEMLAGQDGYLGTIEGLQGVWGGRLIRWKLPRGIARGRGGVASPWAKARTCDSTYRRHCAHHRGSRLMPRCGPTTRAELIRCLRQLGFRGPYSGGRQQFMVRQQLRVRISNPHQGDIRRNLLSVVLRQWQVSLAEWENV